MEKEKIQQMQMIEQNLQHVVVQKQSAQSDMNEIDTAVEHLSEDGENYLSVGNIMVRRSAEEIRKDLDEKKRVLSIRLGTIEKQEKRLEAKKAELQKALMEEMKGDEDE